MRAKRSSERAYGFLQLEIGVAVLMTGTSQPRVVRLQRRNVHLVTHRRVRYRVSAQLLQPQCSTAQIVQSY